MSTRYRLTTVAADGCYNQRFTEDLEEALVWRDATPIEEKPQLFVIEEGYVYPYIDGELFSLINGEVPVKGLKYYQIERDYYTPRLEALGFIVQCVFNTDSDDFGPLGRAFRVVNPDGKCRVYSHG